MRASSLHSLIARVVVVIVALIHSARANTVVVLADPEHVAVMGPAMQVALASRGAAIATGVAPAGELLLDRAAAAQHVALELGADAAVWLEVAPETLEVCVVSVDGTFRHAPLPAHAPVWPRVFAAIATSLLDELLAPGDPHQNLDVNLNVNVNLGPGMVAPQVPPAIPGMFGAPGALATIAVAPATRRVRANRTLLELGPRCRLLYARREVARMLRHDPYLARWLRPELAS